MSEESVDLTPGVVWTEAQLAVVRQLSARAFRAEQEQGRLGAQTRDAVEANVEWQLAVRRLERTIARVEALRQEWDTGVLLSRRFAANELRRALDGES